MANRSFSFLFLVCLIFFCSCKKTGSCIDDELSLVKTVYKGSRLKINGFYIENKANSELYTDLKFLYKNSTVLGFQDYNNEENNLGNLNIEKINGSLKSKAAWGMFHVSNNIVVIEQWAPSASGCFRTIFEIGEIISDSTFVIKRREYRNKGKIEKVEKVNSTFYFKSLEQKPDSTNNFIK